MTVILCKNYVTIHEPNKHMSKHHWPVVAAIFFALLSPVFRTSAAPPPIPKTPAQEERHPKSIPLWPNGAPGFESKKDVPEKVDWRQEPDIVFPVTSGIH